MLQLNGNLSYEGKWYDYRGARLKVRPYPASEGNITLSDQGPVVVGRDQLAAFLYSLEEWEDVMDAAGDPLPCTEEVKKKIFDFQIAGIPLFVLSKSRQFRQDKDAQEKNS